MNRWVWLVPLVLSLVILGPVSLARGDGAGCDEKANECTIEVVIDDPASPPAGNGDGRAATKEKLPQCSAFSGGTVVVPGTPIGDIPAPDRPKPGWIRITCLSGGAPMWLWMDPGVNAEAIAKILLARLKLRPVTIGWTPKRAGAMGFVGVPTWLWVDRPGRVTWGPATISAGAVSLTARVESMTWSMGNGDQVRCATKGTVWERGMGAGPSPSCGYTYDRQGTYRVTATSHWVARWSGYGRSGAIPLSLSQERTLEVGEIQVIVNR